MDQIMKPKAKPERYFEVTATLKKHHLLADPGTPGILRVRYLVCEEVQNNPSSVFF